MGFFEKSAKKMRLGSFLEGILEKLNIFYNFL